MSRKTANSYRPAMGMTLLRRLLLVLTALAFVLGVALPGVALAVPEKVAAGGLTSAGSAAQPHDPCCGEAPSGPAGSKMMSCGGAAYAGAMADVAFPPLPDRRSFAVLEYPTQAYPGLAGLILPPDPFPPRLNILV
ncbi:hypothetical protein QMO56_23795 [Roseomonas sp. E05]|uniref:hypothetical protein n=1 Tax=Roseomonas sp. E05 TaxID=3046310 RepID=UPI0024B897FE|nr:hypothetical protein [Roseomonas sp. E05]MDJ0391139.1 hypothetical protein [Roseomonas sp. E05]